MTKKIKLRDAIASDLKKNQYLKQLHQELLRAYGLQLFGKEFQFKNKSIQDLLVFADIMSKTEDVKLEQLSLEIVICLNKMYPQSHSIKFYKNQISKNWVIIRGQNWIMNISQVNLSIQ